MSAEELLQQFLAVASRAGQSGKSTEQIVGVMEIAKSVVIGQAVTITKPSPIIPFNGTLPPSRG